MKIKLSEVLSLLESIKKKNDVLKFVDAFPDDINQSIETKYILSKTLLGMLQTIEPTDEFEFPEGMGSGIEDIRQVSTFLSGTIQIMIEKFKTPECQECGTCIPALPILEELISDEPEINSDTFNIMSQTIGSIQ